MAYSGAMVPPPVVIPDENDVVALGGAAPELASELTAWALFLTAERRCSPLTVEAYCRDVRQFLTFRAGADHAPVSLERMASLKPSDIRAFMADRRNAGSGSRTIMRALAALRSFARHLERRGMAKLAPFNGVRTPKIAKGLPKPLPFAAAVRVTSADARSGDADEPWVVARDAAVLGLLYGAGLRISEALGLKRRDIYPGLEALTVLGKGRKSRNAPVIGPVKAAIEDYIRLCPYPLPCGRSPVRGGEGRASVAANHPAGDGADAGRAGPARFGDAARAQAFVRHALARARRRPAFDPGIARACIAVHDADLHRG